MWQGIYKRWNPVPYLEGKRLYVEAVHDDWEGFRLWFSSENKNLGVVLVVKFGHVQMYVNSDEAYRLSIVKNNEELNFPHAFWKVEDSDLLKEFHRQSKNFYADAEIEHYAFLSCSDCIDILSFSKPDFVEMLIEGEIKELQ